MAGSFPMRRGLDEFFLCRRLEDCKGAAPGVPTPMKFYERVSALVFIRSCITDPELERKLWLWIQSDPRSQIRSDDERDLLDHVANRIARGDLIVAKLKREGDAETNGILRGSQGQAGAKSQKSKKPTERTPLQDEMAARQQSPEPDVITVGEEEPETTWIEIELLDPDGRPAANERYKLTLPDGSFKFGRLDENGKARVERLQPGNCQVTFPDRDEQVWDVG